MSKSVPGGKRRAVYPGSFDPPTIAHVAIALATLEQCRCDSLSFALSYGALGKEGREATIGNRLTVLADLFAHDPRFEVVTTPARLIVDIAAGFDVVVVGADKWEQILDPQWYPDGEAGRDRAVATLPHIALTPRPPVVISPDPVGDASRVTILQLHNPELAGVSSSAVRDGRSEWRAERHPLRREGGASDR